MSKWTTRFPRELMPPSTDLEMHTVILLPNDWPGKGAMIALLIPECETQYFAPGGAPIIVNRTDNKDVEYWMKFVCEQAAEQNAGVSFCCDTVKQAEQAAEDAIKLLPLNYERVALERMERPQDLSRGKLS